MVTLKSILESGISTEDVIFILLEKELPKKTWIRVASKDLKDFESDIVSLIKNAYAGIGGHPNYTGSGLPPDGSDYEVIDLDDDPEPDAVEVAKRRSGGSKHVAMGHDGTSPAKSSVVNRTADQLKKKGHYVEVSGKIKDILTSKGVAIVNDEETVLKALKGKTIKWHGDGSYTRDIGGSPHRKTMMGKPNK